MEVKREVGDKDLQPKIESREEDGSHRVLSSLLDDQAASSAAAPENFRDGRNPPYPYQPGMSDHPIRSREADRDRFEESLINIQASIEALRGQVETNKLGAPSSASSYSGLARRPGELQSRYLHQRSRGHSDQRRKEDSSDGDLHETLPMRTGGTRPTAPLRPRSRAHSYDIGEEERHPRGVASHPPPRTQGVEMAPVIPPPPQVGDHGSATVPTADPRQLEAMMAKARRDATIPAYKGAPGDLYPWLDKVREVLKFKGTTPAQSGLLARQALQGKAFTFVHMMNADQS